MARTVVEGPLLPLLGLDIRSSGGVNHNQFAGHPAGFIEEHLTLRGWKMPVEVAGEDPVERAIGYHQVKSITNYRQPTGTRDWAMATMAEL